MRRTSRLVLSTSLLAAAFCLTDQPASADDDVVRHTVISVSKNIRIDNAQLTRDVATPDCPVDWSITKRVLHGGKQEGVDIIEVNNGKLTFVVIPTRGMGVLSVTMGDIRLGWDSPVKEVVHPRHINLNSRGGLGWLEGFNEWMCRCGLESNGQTGLDKFINNVGDEAEMELTLHGKIANIPAQEVDVIVDKKPPYRIRIRGRVDEKMFYGPKLELYTEISTEPGSNSFRISDELINVGAQSQEFQMLYHSNYGRPLLEEGSTIVVPARKVSPFNENAAKSIETFDTYKDPILGFIEQVYCMRLAGDDDSRTTIMLRNRIQDRAVSMSWSLKELPYLTVWKNTAAEKDGYVTGLEPGTNFPYNRRVERKHGRVPKLNSGAKYRMSIDFTIHADKEAVAKVTTKIRQLVGDRQPELAKTLEVVDDNE